MWTGLPKLRIISFEDRWWRWTGIVDDYIHFYSPGLCLTPPDPRYWALGEGPRKRNLQLFFVLCLLSGQKLYSKQSPRRLPTNRNILLYLLSIQYILPIMTIIISKMEPPLGMQLGSLQSFLLRNLQGNHSQRKMPFSRKYLVVW